MKFSISKEGIVNQTELFTDDLSIQQYVRTALHTAAKELGYKVVDEWEMDDDSIELTIEDGQFEEFTHDSEGC